MRANKPQLIPYGENKHIVSFLVRDSGYLEINITKYINETTSEISIVISGNEPHREFPWQYLMIDSKESANKPSLIWSYPYIIAAEDTIAPAFINDLSIINSAIESITLTWTALGDDENIGIAAGYVVKYSTSGPITDSNWDSTSTYTQAWIPLTAGSTETHVLSGLNSDTQYWFAIKAYDEIPNYGNISNSPSEKTAKLSETTPPAVDSPPDITYEEGTTGHVISWNATDDNLGTYVIYKDSIEVNSGGCASGIPIKINVDGLAVGTYNYTIVVSDAFNNTAIDTVFVKVTSSEVIPPQLLDIYGLY